LIPPLPHVQSCKWFAAARNPSSLLLNLSPKETRIVLHLIYDWSQEIVQQARSLSFMSTDRGHDALVVGCKFNGSMSCIDC
jgi:hypothetical protein